MNPYHDDPRLTAYLLDELSGEERGKIEALLETSPEARRAVRGIEETIGLLKREFISGSEFRLTPEQRQRLEAAALLSGRRGLYKVYWAAGLAAAACLVVVAVRQVPWDDGSRPVDPQVLEQTTSPVETNEEPQREAVTELPSQPETRSPIETTEATAGRVTAESKSGKSVEVSPVPEVGTVSEEVTVQSSPIDVQTEAAEVGSERARKVTRGLVGGVPGGVIGGIPQPASHGPGMAVPPPMPAMASDAAAVDLPGRYNPDFHTEGYDRIEDNPFIAVATDPLSTFSIDVDTASYSNVRRFLNQRQLPPKDAVRIEELVNYFPYEYAPPSGSEPFSVHIETAAAPWKPEHRLVRFGIKGKEIDMSRRPAGNFVFLIDVSGSMQPPNKLPLLKSALKLLVENLRENDRVALAVYAGASGLVLPSTPGSHQETLCRALEQLEAGGSTNGGAGIQLAYRIASEHFIPGGLNRVILATDGDFNVGLTSEGELTRLIEAESKKGVFLSVLGFGMGNYKDSTLEKLADRGNGNYAYIDSLAEARKVLVEEMGGTLVTIAKDVKLQVEFNPAEVAAYRLIGYENRLLRHQDFNDDTKDAGEIGAGHTLTVLYEIVPRGVSIPLPEVDRLKYQRPEMPATGRGELMTLKLRHKDPNGESSRLMERPISAAGKSFSNASGDFRFAAAVAAFGMVLRESPHRGNATLDWVIETAGSALEGDRGGYRSEFLRLVQKARAIRDLEAMDSRQ